uniref:Uncharacterized protein n=1 Tax=Anguilla anguilla TaxID=7936 RepID=A0A0E9UU62_ANGAN
MNILYDRTALLHTGSGLVQWVKLFQKYLQNSLVFLLSIGSTNVE